VIAVTLPGMSAVAATTPPMGPVRPMAGVFGDPVILTPDAVATFITSYAAVKQGADDVGKRFGVAEDGATPSDMWGAWFGVTAAWGEMNALVAPYGYPDFLTWLKTTMSVAMAYTFAKEGGEMDANMAQALALIENNPSLSDDQKKMMADQMQASLGVLGAIRPPQENVDAVKPYLDQLATLFH